jgi:endonuclease YncB( thermonuclease family)
VVRVYDGDTFYGIVKTWPGIIGDTVGIRIYGIDTPEMKGVPDSVKDLALKAKALTGSLLLSGKRVTLKNMRRDKYFRILADVWVGNINVADTLIKAGLARPYSGGTKEEW